MTNNSLSYIIYFMNLVTETVQDNTGRNPLLKEMVESGVVYGRKKSILHPSAKQYLSGVRGTIVLFDLNKTLENIDKAAGFLKGLNEKKSLVLVVGTQPGIAETLTSFAHKQNYAYVTNRWLGGTLTNFKIMSGRLQHFMKLREDFATGKYEKYPKKERTKLRQELDKLETKWSGLELLKQLPGAVIIVDINEHSAAYNEAKQLNIPMIAIMNSNTNFKDVDYPIPANSSAPASIKWIINYIDKKI